jgi:hypothetical protein
MASAIACIARWHGLAGVMVCSFWFVEADPSAGPPGAGAGLTLINNDALPLVSTAALDYYWAYRS